MRVNGKLFKKITLIVSAVVMGLVLAAIALAAVSQFPMFLSSNTPPNIMILLDNSGSMDTIMQHPAYDPNISYKGSFKSDLTYFQRIDYSSGKVYLTASMADDTANGDSNGNYTKGGVTRKLPFPYVNTRWDGNYLNWIFFTATKSQFDSLNTDPSLQMTRIQTARSVISSLVKNVSGVRFGLTKLNVDGGNDPQGGNVVKGCGNLTADNVDATVNAINAGTWTPLGEALSEVWQYFSGSSSLYNSGSYTSPIICPNQKNFSIIVTDGEPTYDGCYRGVFNSYGCNNSETASSHLADIAGYMHTHDASSTFDGMQSVDTFTIGMTVDSALLRLAAANGGGSYYTTTSGMDLATAMQNAVNVIIGKVSSATAVAVNAASLTTSTKLFTARFDSGDWTGYLEAFKFDKTTGTSVNYPNTPLWEAGAVLNKRTSARTIYTASDPVGTYQRLDFTTSNQPTLATIGFRNFSSNWISYVRGDATPSGYRSRRSKLGDIVYSSPVVYGPPDGYYRDHDYPLFKTNNANRQQLVLVGANDGMLHAFNVDTGNEEWAFIPNSLLPNLKLLRNIPYVHTNYVDGPLTIGDAYITSKGADGKSDASPAWHSIAVGGLRGGGKSYFALDLTDPLNPIPLWEVKASPSNGLGYSFGTPLILKVRDSSQPYNFRWVAALPNGYEGTASGRAASLLIVDLASGAIVKEIVVDNSSFAGVSLNGLASPVSVDLEGDGYADYLYAGDLYGHLWKFDLTSNKSAYWQASLLFSATDSSGFVQPITTKPEVAFRNGLQFVFFGTGKYFEASDKTTTQTQTIYGIKDDNAGSGSLTRSNLTRQTVSQVSVGSNTYRQSSNNDISATKGWYLDLPLIGERVIYDPVVEFGTLLVTTFTPTTDPCTSGGISWLMGLYVNTGGKLPEPIFGNNASFTGISLGTGMASGPVAVPISNGRSSVLSQNSENAGLGGSGSGSGSGSDPLTVKHFDYFTLRSWRQVK